MPFGCAGRLVEGLRLVGQGSALVRQDLSLVDVGKHNLNVLLPAAIQGVSRHGIIGRRAARSAAPDGDSPAHWHYAAAKAGMVAMHKTIARAYASEGILSFAITPGFTDTSMAGDYLESRGGPGLRKQSVWSRSIPSSIM